MNIPGILFAALLAAAATPPLSAVEYHVAVTGDNANDGSSGKPLKTIQAAAELAKPGDVITVRAGVYREWVDPPRGGESDTSRITYQAAPGETVTIKGSEIVKGWKKVRDDLWTVTLPDSFFGKYNPYADLIHGDYLNANKLNQHTGQVYLDGAPLTEASGKAEIDAPAGTAVWLGEVKDGTTTLWARFKNVDPNARTVEINVRRSVFYPAREHVNHITVRGFVMSQSATNWAPPTAEQIGLIGSHWSKGWVIENNVISHARCVGITLGKFGDEHDNTYAMDSQGFVKGVKEAVDYGWSKEAVGHHRVADNTISFCGQAGIVGSLGAVFSTVTGNEIHDIALGQRFGGFECAGIKFHAPVDVVIRGNHIHRTERGIWLDWMSQGARVTGNLLHSNLTQDLFVEVNHGPMMVDNNLFLSGMAVFDGSSGGAYCHNIFTGSFQSRVETRSTPFFKNHSVEIVRSVVIDNGDDRFYHNLFIGTGLDRLGGHKRMAMQGNVFLKGGKPGGQEPQPLVDPADPELKLVRRNDGWHLELTAAAGWTESQQRPLVTTGLLGRALTPDLPFENPDGSVLKINTDYFGKPRNPQNPFPGPFEALKSGKQEIKVWPK